MLLLEHQGKALLRRGGIATPKGVVVTTAAELEAALPALDTRLVLKAQIAVGGRGKGGGIDFAHTPDEARSIFKRLRTQTINGHSVDSVLVEDRIDYLRERFVALIVEDGDLQLLMGRNGGIHIEDTAANNADSIVALHVDPIDGPHASDVTNCIASLGIPPEYHPAYCEVARALFRLAQECDARLVEINPLVELADARVLALDAKVVIDQDALGRHPEFSLQDSEKSPPAAHQSGRGGLIFKPNPDAGGTIGLIGLGGGLNVTLMDWIESLGGKIATLVDIDPAIASGRAREGFRAAIGTFDHDPAIRAILVNIITCGYRLDDIVAAMMEALRSRPAGSSKPIVLHLRGNSMSLTPSLLASHGCSNSPSISAAVAAVVEAGSL